MSKLVGGKASRMRDRLNSGKCSKYLKALADPERLKIVQCLQAGPRPVGEITRDLGSVVANVSHHLKLLREAGVVTSEKRGRFVIYKLSPEILGHDAKSPLNVLDFGCCRIELGKTEARGAHVP